MKISVIGTGYVGLVTAACFADLGHEVNAYDISNQKISALRKGRIPFFEPNLEKISLASIKKGKLKFTSSLKANISFSDVYFLCVGTPQKPSGEPQLKYIKDYFNDLIKLIKNKKSFIKNTKAKKYIFIKSTIPPGTINSLTKLLKKNNLEKKIILSSNPEFLREGSAVSDFMRPDRVILGCDDSNAIKIGKGLYKKLVRSSRKILVTSQASAEIIKYSSNAFLAMKISFVNQISRLSDVMNADINEISKGIGFDKRINPHFLNAGIGFGGSCFPKDVKGLEYVLRQKKLSSDLASATLKINSTQMYYFLDKILKLYSKSELKDKSIALWGLAFKPNTDDIRESVSIKIIQELAPNVKKIFAYDPIASDNAKLKLLSFNNIVFLDSEIDCLSNSDFLIINTEYPEFKTVSINAYSCLKDKCIFDGRNILDKDKLINSGFKYFGIGR